MDKEKLKSIFKNMIYNIYNDYKIFSDTTNIDDFEIDFFKSDKETGGVIARVYSNDIYIMQTVLHCSINVFALFPDQVPVIMFHEFTHILDGCMLRAVLDEKDFTIVMKLYSEFHASKIELMKALDFKSINETKTISLLDKILFLDRYITVGEYLNDRFDECYTKINKVINYCGREISEIVKLDLDAIQKLMYYMGTLDMCQKYSENTVVNRIGDLQEAFKSNAFELYNILSKDLLYKSDYDDILRNNTRLNDTFKKIHNIKTKPTL